MAKRSTKTKEVIETPVTETAPAKGTKTVEPIKMSATQQKGFDELSTKSAQIRFLNDEGFTRGQIAKYLSVVYKKEVRYQHVRNVLETPLKRTA